MLELLVSMFGPDLLACLKDITEKQAPAKLKPIVGTYHLPCIPQTMKKDELKDNDILLEHGKSKHGITSSTYFLLL